MAYIKQNWKTGDVITADKLNHMEYGIAGDLPHTTECCAFVISTEIPDDPNDEGKLMAMVRENGYWNVGETSIYPGNLIPIDL